MQTLQDFEATTASAKITDQGDALVSFLTEKVWDCEFRSVEECAPHVIAGNRGFCNINPGFVPPPYAAPIKHRKRRS
jgi:hypothetical protein